MRLGAYLSLSVRGGGVRLGAYLSLSVRGGGGVVVGGAYSRLGAY